MKKLNKKGFTLAELLIVIAIIAILIAIAIPVFGGQMDNARLQTDHANIRSAYAMAQVANLEGYVYVGTDGTTMDTPAGNQDYYFEADGSLFKKGGTGTANHYVLKATVKSTDTAAKCGSSAVCMNGEPHTAGNNIIIRYTAPTGTATGGWTVELEASTSTPSPAGP